MHRPDAGVRLPALFVITATLAGVLLAGCSGSAPIGPLGSTNADQGFAGSTMETVTVAETAQAAAAGTPGDSDFNCPPVEVRSGAAAWQVNEKSDGALRYQVSLGQRARECKFTTPDMRVRVGIQGRVLAGAAAAGTGGSLTVPIRLAVVEEGPTPKPVWTKLYTVPVQIGAGVTQLDFSYVAEDVTFPRPQPKVLDKYVIYVGFDPQAGAVAETRARPKPAAPRASAPAQPKPVASRPKPAPSTASASAEPAEPAPTQVRVAPPAPAPAASQENTQWIGAPAPSSGGFSQ